jgi:hypothetical protein
MLRAIAMILLLVWAGPAFATGVDEVPCPSYALSRAQLKLLGAKVHRDTGLRLEDRDPYACSEGGSVTVYSATRYANDPDGAERWYEAHCLIDRLARWKCEYIGQRILRFSDPRRDGDARVFISMTADAVLARRRLEEAWALKGTLAEQNHCDPQEAAAQQFPELRSDLAYPLNHLQIAMEGERFTLWTLRYAIHFTADAPESALQLRCWRARKSPLECMSSSCPA